MEYKAGQEASSSKVSIKGCKDVDDFIKKIKNESQLNIPKNSRITLHGPSGTAISPTKSISVLMQGNSTENPLRVQVSDLSKPASDAELTKFWNSLREISAEGDFLHFPLVTSLIEEDNKTIYIRKAYKDLFNIIWNNVYPVKPNPRRHRMAFTGTPGVGKSMFLFYVMWRLAHEETTKTVILHRQMNRKHIYGFQNDRCWVVPSSTDIGVFLNDPNNWYLADTLEPPPDAVNAVTILVASPARRHYETFSRYLNAAPLRYFPVWSLEELKLVAPFYSRELKDIEKRYYMIGGVPRYVLEKDHDLETIIDGAVGRLAIEKLPLIASGSVSKEDQVSHLIVQFVVDTSSYLTFKLRMASSYATQKAMASFLEYEEEKVKRFIRRRSPHPAMATLQGEFFEAYAHQKLCEGGKFIGRSLETKEECELEFPTMEIGRFFDVSECKDPNLYYIPWYSNHPCIDSVILNKGYFQMTVASKHEIIWSKMKEMVDVLKMYKLYSVVPQTLFGKFQGQNFVGNMGNQGRANEEDTWTSKRSFNDESGMNAKRQRTRRGNNNGNSQKDLVDQYVIPISLEPSMEALLSKIIRKEQMIQHSEKNEGIIK